jgi:hypothetical protein
MAALQAASPAGTRGAVAAGGSAGGARGWGSWRRTTGLSTGLVTEAAAVAGMLLTAASAFAGADEEAGGVVGGNGSSSSVGSCVTPAERGVARCAAVVSSRGESSMANERPISASSDMNHSLTGHLARDGAAGATVLEDNESCEAIT